MPHLNGLQWCMVAMSALSFFSGATGQLTDLFGPTLAHTIVTVAGLANGMITAIMTPLVGNTAQTKNVAAMDGVQVKVSTNAEQSIAKLAVDPAQPNIGAANPADRPKLQAMANA
jgi:hypothetical protein